ncbi:voltage-gated potassium channel subunit beta-2 [Exidia glandulosa HHB12029]|uniref:Voltage-gated potassium channel subunit beta-2 n=1 Tax=Exidia glandulosa HHB12029 TaxID=1314781 RepID=A0A165CRN2_EXIGL|nr:voltage-gated potassium channel subunit beta-2 [Exidia glandulosa HHB12029]
MIYRFLGRSGLRVSAISLGGWLTHGGHTGEEIALATIKAAYDGGVNFFDSAEQYASGKAEILLGKAVRHFGWDRDDLVISTKIYWGEHEDGSKGVNDVGLSRKHVLVGMKKSLKRLQMDYVDLVYAHRPDKYTPMEEVVRAFNYLIESGQAMYWGTSEWSAEEIQDAWRVADKLNLIGPVMEQPQYNMLTRDRVEVEYAPLYRKHGLGLTVFSPLLRGVLTGKYTHGIPDDSRANKAGAEWFRSQVVNGKPMLERVAKLEPIAKKIGATTGQLALAWVVKNESVSSAIIGATSVQQIEENLSALAFVDKLTPEIMEEVEAVLENKPKLPPMRFS